MKRRISFRTLVFITLLAITKVLMTNLIYPNIKTYTMPLQTRVLGVEYGSTHTIYMPNGNNLKNKLENPPLNIKTNTIGNSEDKHISSSKKGLSDLSLHIGRKASNSDGLLNNLTNEVFFFKRRKSVRKVNCQSIIKGDLLEIRKANIGAKIYYKRIISPQTYIRVTINCKQFIQSRAYITSVLTEAEQNFPIAFSVLMYTDVEQTERLLRAIYRPQNIYCIHVDSNTKGDIYNAVKGIANCFENVIITSKRINVTWGTFSVLEPELICMQELLKKSKTWKYFINLTGQEFPLRTNHELVQLLSTFNGSNDVHTQTSLYKFNLRMNGAGEPPHGIFPMKGSVHIVVSRAFVEYVLNEQTAQDFLEWTKLTKIPDETFFASLQSNPALYVPGSNTGSNTGIWYTRFKNWGQFFCRGKYVRNICIFGIGDLPLLASRFELFANKFHLDYHPFALDCIEELHYNRTRDEYFGKLKFDARRYSRGGLH